VPVFHCDFMSAFVQPSFIVHWMPVGDFFSSHFWAVRIDVVTPSGSRRVCAHDGSCVPNFCEPAGVRCRAGWFISDACDAALRGTAVGHKAQRSGVPAEPSGATPLRRQRL